MICRYRSRTCQPYFNTSFVVNSAGVAEWKFVTDGVHHNYTILLLLHVLLSDPLYICTKSIVDESMAANYRSLLSKAPIGVGCGEGVSPPEEGSGEGQRPLPENLLVFGLKMVNFGVF